MTKKGSTDQSDQSTQAPPLYESLPLYEDTGDPPDLVDSDLVLNAMTEISLIFLEHALNAYLEVATYLFKTFFNSDWELLRQKTPAHGKASSYNELVRKLKTKNPTLPGRSWLHNSVRMLLAEKDVEEKIETEEIVHIYGQLHVSHKIAMFPLKTSQKENLIVDIFGNGLTVNETKERVSELLGKGSKKETPVGFSQKTKSISKQVQKWQDQIAASMKEGTSDQQEKFKELNTFLSDLVKDLDNLEKSNG